MNDPLRLDAWSREEGVRRNEPVRLQPDALRIGDRSVGLGDVRWKARRADLLILFTSHETVALRGDADALNGLDRQLRRRLPAAPSRTRYLREVAGEVLRFAAAVAARGRVGGRPVTGLHVAVVTRAALHLYAEDARRTLSFPAERSRLVERAGDGTGGTVVLAGAEDRLELLYLYPEEQTALLQASRQA